MSIPSWEVFVLLGLAAWRTWFLVGRDSILDPVRDRLVSRWHRVADFLDCPFCAGFWIALCWWAVWEAWPHGVAVAAAAVAITALVPLIDAVSSASKS